MALLIVRILDPYYKQSIYMEVKKESFKRVRAWRHHENGGGRRRADLSRGVGGTSDQRPRGLQ
jgi:hypothetical protein